MIYFFTIIIVHLSVYDRSLNLVHHLFVYRNNSKFYLTVYAIQPTVYAAQRDVYVF